MADPAKTLIAMLALLLTIFIEFFPIFFLLSKEHSSRFIIFSVIVVNMITNPLANYLYPEYSFWIIESGVLMIEALLFSLLFGTRLRKGGLLSLAANIPTIILSLVMFLI